jgi:hypothetical protein
MTELHADILCHILQSLEATALNLSLLNNLKAVGKQWLRTVRRVLGQHAGGVGMLELFRHDCVQHVGVLQLPMH